jgi:protein-S-isoprenylcysteine O-methyltransferase Ste14
MDRTLRLSLPNLSLALLLVGIVASWFWQSNGDAAVQLGYGLIALTTVSLAVMALIRPPARIRDERWWVLGICTISMVYAFNYRFDPSNPNLRFIFWGRIGLQFVAGLALLSLGKSYALLPALRQVRRGFLYSYVRHPVYGMYILADLVVILLQPTFWNLATAAIGATAFYLRSRLEENVLCRDWVYVDYMQAVPWRFIPGVF